MGRFVRRQIQLDVLSRQRKRLVRVTMVSTAASAGVWELLTRYVTWLVQSHDADPGYDAETVSSIAWVDATARGGSVILS